MGKLRSGARIAKSRSAVVASAARSVGCPPYGRSPDDGVARVFGHPRCSPEGERRGNERRDVGPTRLARPDPAVREIAARGALDCVGELEASEVT